MKIAIHFFTGEYPPEPGGVADHTAGLVQELAELALVPVILSGGDAGLSVENGTPVYRVGRAFAPVHLRYLARALDAFPGPRVIFIQYVPHAFGLRGMNLPLVLWLAWRACVRRDRLIVLFHEVAFPFQKGPIRHRVLAIVQQCMASLMAAVAWRILVTTTAWLPRLRCVSNRVVTSLPVFSNLPESVAAEVVWGCRTHWLQRTGANCLVGHFGTYGSGISNLLLATIMQLSDKLAATTAFLLMGRGAAIWLQQASSALAERAACCHVVEDADRLALATTLAACDTALQPYPDGITTRRTTAMSALSLDVPLVSNDGPLTDPCWRTDLPCARLAATPDGAALATSLAEVLQLPLAERVAAGAHGRAWYTVHASLAHAAKVVKQIVEECQHR